MGAQLQCRLSGMLFAECQGLTYAHTPFTTMDFTPANETDWPAKWERFIGVGVGELAAADIARELGEPRRISNPTQMRMIENTFWSVPGCHEYADLFPHRYLRLTERFAARYAAAPKDGCEPYYTQGSLNVALHLRRGKDLGHKMHLWTTDEYSATVVETIVDTARNAGKPCMLRVFSQGSESDFSALHRFGVEFHLNEDLFKTFHSLISADVLVMAKSDLSYCAALLSKGVKIYQPTVHQPLPGWLVAGQDGGLDKRSVERALKIARHN